MTFLCGNTTYLFYSVDTTEDALFCVAITHLLFNPKAGEVKLAQLAYLFAELHKMASNSGLCDFRIIILLLLFILFYPFMVFWTHKECTAPMRMPNMIMVYFPNVARHIKHWKPEAWKLSWKLSWDNKGVLFLCSVASLMVVGNGFWGRVECPTCKEAWLSIKYPIHSQPS